MAPTVPERFFFRAQWKSFLVLPNVIRVNTHSKQSDKWTGMCALLKRACVRLDAWRGGQGAEHESPKGKNEGNPEKPSAKDEKEGTLDLGNPTLEQSTRITLFNKATMSLRNRFTRREVTVARCLLAGVGSGTLQGALPQMGGGGGEGEAACTPHTQDEDGLVASTRFPGHVQHSPPPPPLKGSQETLF